jgi:hypothetical protein
MEFLRYLAMSNGTGWSILSFERTPCPICICRTSIITQKDTKARVKILAGVGAIRVVSAVDFANITPTFLNGLCCGIGTI